MNLSRLRGEDAVGKRSRLEATPRGRIFWWPLAQAPFRVSRCDSRSACGWPTGCKAEGTGAVDLGQGVSMAVVGALLGLPSAAAFVRRRASGLAKHARLKLTEDLSYSE
jgi:hypothetical protein